MTSHVVFSPSSNQLTTTSAQLRQASPLKYSHALLRLGDRQGSPEIREAAGTGDYQGFDRNWDHWLATSNPNDSKLSDHEKANVEELCITTRHHTGAVHQLEERME